MYASGRSFGAVVSKYAHAAILEVNRDGPISGANAKARRGTRKVRLEAMLEDDVVEGVHRRATQLLRERGQRRNDRRRHLGQRRRADWR